MTEKIAGEMIKAEKCLKARFLGDYRPKYIIEELHENGFFHDERSKPICQDYLMYAAQKNNLPLAKYFLEEANTDPKLRDYNGYSALDLAVKSDSAKIVDIMIRSENAKEVPLGVRLDWMK